MIDSNVMSAVDLFSDDSGRVAEGQVSWGLSALPDRRLGM